MSRLFSLPSQLVLFLTLFASPALLAQATGTIEGQTLHEGRHVGGVAEARLAEIGRKTKVDDDGHFRFENVPVGTYNVIVLGPAGTGVATVEVEADVVSEVEIELEIAAHFGELVVTGTSEPRNPLDLSVPTTVVSGEELQLRLQPSLGETLDGEPGVNSTFFGVGASRPIIRGQSGDRVRMLEGGLGTGDVSSLSPDHAVSLDPMLARQIEIIRGPSTLLYGSSAIGGAVNVLDELIPAYRADEPLSGSVQLRGATVNDEGAGALTLHGGGGNWAWHADGVWRDTDDYEIPGFARVEGTDEHDDHGDEDHGEEEHDEEENPFGVLPNSDVETRNGRVGASYFFGDRGYLGVSVAGLESEYGLPGGHVHAHGDEDHGEEEHEGEEHDEEHGEEEEEGPVRIDLDRLRYDLRSEIQQSFGIFRGFRMRLGVTDYEHSELEGDEVGTTFFNDEVEGRFELVQQRRGNWSGSMGLQYSNRDLEALGPEAFIPANDTDRFGIFTYQDVETGDVTWQFGARWESQDIAADGFRGRSDDGLSGSVGLVWSFAERWSLAGSLARSVKLPIAEELYSDGLHVATEAYEIGNPFLTEETALGFDLSLRRTEGRVTGELSFFRNAYDDFIYQAFTGEEREGFPVVLYTQDDATFVGGEISARIELAEFGTGDLHLQLAGDYVQAELDDRAEYLPRIPPLSVTGGLHFHSSTWSAMAEVRWVDDQTDTAPLETPTDGYTLVNASVGHRFLLSRQVLDVLLIGRNLTDEEARKHTSYLKDSVPLPGRDISLSLRFAF